MNRFTPAAVHATALALALAAAATTVFAQKTWVNAPTFGPAASESAVNPGVDLTDILPAGMTRNIGGWDWLGEDRIVFTHWEWKPPAAPTGEIWTLDGVKSHDKAKIIPRRYWSGALREPLGVKVVGGEVYVAVKFALLKLVDADRNGIAEDTVQIAAFPHKREPEETWNHYSMDVKHKGGFFYVALPSETVAYGYPGYPVMPTRGTVARIDPARKSVEYLITGLRTPDGLGWGPDSALFVTDNQGAWLPSSKLIHVTGNRFFGLQPVEAGDPSLVESPPAVWMPHGEGSSSPTQPLLLEKGPFAGQFLVGDNVLGFVNRVSLDKVQGEWQGALFHFTGGLTCGVHRLLQNAIGDVYFGGLGSPINTWNVKDKYYGLQVARFNGKLPFEVKEIQSRADGFTLRFSAPVGPSAEDVSSYRLFHWRYQSTKAYGGAKLNNAPLNVTTVTVDPTRTWVHLAVPGLAAGRVVHFQFHRDLQSAEGKGIWTGEAWYTLNRISEVRGLSPTRVEADRRGAPGAADRVLATPRGYALRGPAGAELAVFGLDGRLAWRGRYDAAGTAFLDRDRIRMRAGLHILARGGARTRLWLGGPAD